MVILESARLVMRNYRTSDLPEYHKILSDKENMYFFAPFGIITDSMEASRESLKYAIDYNENGEGYRFCVTLKENDEMIGVSAII